MSRFEDLILSDSDGNRERRSTGRRLGHAGLQTAAVAFDNLGDRAVELYDTLVQLESPRAHGRRGFQTVGHKE